MTNWENEVHSVISREQEKLIIAKRDEQEKIKDLKLRGVIDYENNVLPAYELLDKLGVKESLEEIKDQIWGKGEIKKNVNSLEEYSLNYNNYFHGVSYTLKSPTYLEYRKVDGGWQDDYSEIGETYDSLIVGTDLKSLWVGNTKNEFSITDQNFPKISEWLKNELVKDCLNRKDYKKRDYDQMTKSAIQNHPTLASKFLIENPKWEIPQTPKTKRSFLDKLFG